MALEFKFIPRSISEKYGLFNPSLEETILEVDKWAKICESDTQIIERLKLDEYDSDFFKLILRQTIAMSKKIIVPEKHNYRNTLTTVEGMFNKQTLNMVGNVNMSQAKISFFVDAAGQIAKEYIFPFNGGRANLRSIGITLESMYRTSGIK